MDTRKPIGRPRIHTEGTTKQSFHTTPPARQTLHAWAVQYTTPAERLRTGRNMSASEALRQICMLAQKKIERDLDRARSNE